MEALALFTDVSLHPQKKIGMGAYLLIHHSIIELESEELYSELVLNKIKLRKYGNSSSSKLEVQTVIWALEEIMKKYGPDEYPEITLFTDSQCVTGLPRRREKLESTAFIGQRTKKLLNNADLYRQFYKYSDAIGFNIIKVKGHTKSKNKDSVHRIFSYVDREVRHKHKEWMFNMK